MGWMVEAYAREKSLRANSLFVFSVGCIKTMWFGLPIRKIVLRVLDEKHMIRLKYG